MVTQLIEFFLSNFLAINLLVTLFSGNPLLLKVGITGQKRKRRGQRKEDMQEIMISYFYAILAEGV
jgi:hypothetical protein